MSRRRPVRRRTASRGRAGGGGANPLPWVLVGVLAVVAIGAILFAKGQAEESKREDARRATDAYRDAVDDGSTPSSSITEKAAEARAMREVAEERLAQARKRAAETPPVDTRRADLAKRLKELGERLAALRPLRDDLDRALVDALDAVSAGNLDMADRIAGQIERDLEDKPVAAPAEDLAAEVQEALGEAQRVTLAGHLDGADLKESERRLQILNDALELWQVDASEANARALRGRIETFLSWVQVRDAQGSLRPQHLKTMLRLNARVGYQQSHAARHPLSRQKLVVLGSHVSSVREMAGAAEQAIRNVGKAPQAILDAQQTMAKRAHAILDEAGVP